MATESRELINRLQSNAARQNLTTPAAANDTHQALMMLRQEQSNHAASKATVEQWKLSAEQTEANRLMTALELDHVATKLRKSEHDAACARQEHARHYRKAKAGKAKVVAQLREARTALQAIKDEVETNRIPNMGVLVRAYSAVLDQ